MLYNISDKQRVIGYRRKKFKKRAENIWSICRKPLLLHPLSRTKRFLTETKRQRKHPFIDRLKAKATIGSRREWKMSYKMTGLSEGAVLGFVTSWKKLPKIFSKKSSPKIWRIYEKLLTFASAFPMKRKVPFGEIDLWKIYITRQSSTRAESEMIPGKNRQIPYYSNII